MNLKVITARYWAVLMIIAALVVEPVSAGVGESEETNRLLYGAPVGMEEVAGFDRSMRYKTSLYDITILYRNGLAQVATYRLGGNKESIFTIRSGKRISIRRIESLLDKVNLPQGAGRMDNSWYFDGSNTSSDQIGFIDVGKRTAASYDLRTESLTIRLMAGE